ncbi:uncharacterized protein LOC111638748 [Centruroides sculpturatus]|uniref:uncharacterized protein LOC111638748 n=1 Tax=Centruroides sculpturatus TaxID=218467 RepID=UPI000C6D1901|nr:uncharacterized protein LOC111638748 [Centruroides sculpturatus]
MFSNTFADAMLFYKQREVTILKNADVTISFIRHINALFDALNRRLPQEGIRHDSNDLKVIEESLEWLNRWEAFRLQIRSTDQKGFLSHQTAENLRLTHPLIANKLLYATVNDCFENLDCDENDKDFNH